MGVTKPKVVKHLSNIEIDEVSLVDRGANQHATIAIAKRAPEEELMPTLFSEEGTPLAEDELVDGQIVFDEEGNAYQFSEDDAADEQQVEEFVEEPELAMSKGFEDDDIEKAGSGSIANAARNFKLGWKNPDVKGGSTGSYKAGQKVRRNPGKTAAALFGGGGIGGYAMAKSFSEEVMEELSKAYSDEERDQVLSKALGRVEELVIAQEEAIEIAKAERDLRLTREYVSKAAEYNVPIDPEELGPVLYRMAESMSHEDCAVINKALEAAGSAIFDEVGYIGGGDNVDVLGQVNAAAMEYVGKSADMSREEALDAVFEANPSAYDEYLAQRRGY